MTEPLIHLVEYSSQPDIKLFCMEEYTSPEWGDKAIIRKDLGLNGGIYLAQNDERYCFGDAVATCPKCIKLRLDAILESIEHKLNILKKK